MRELYRAIVIKNKCKPIDLINLLPHEDGWLTPNDIISTVQEIILNKPNDDFIIFPLSEIIRFYSDNTLISTLMTLCESESGLNKHQRIYIPLIGMQERFSDFKHHFNREWASMWQLNENAHKKTRVKIYDYNSCNLDEIPSAKTTDVLHINTTKKWLNLWREERNELLYNTPIICCSKSISTLFYYSKPDSFFEFDEVSNIKQVIETQYNINLPIPYLNEEKLLWEQLRNKLSDLAPTNVSSNFEKLVSHIFNVHSLSAESFLTMWIRHRAPLHKWLLLHYYTISKEKTTDSYLVNVLNNMSQPYTDEKLEDLLWILIYKNEKITIPLMTERLNLLKEYYALQNTTVTSALELEIESQLRPLLDKCKTTKEKLLLLTGISNIEKKLIVIFSSDAIKSNELSRLELTKIYKLKYPTLYNYLTHIELDNIDENIKWINDYFEEYRWSKIINTKTDNLNKILNKVNKDNSSFYNWYYEISSPHKLLKDFSSKSDVDSILWIDALGLEWINLLYSIISNKNYMNKIMLGRANIPTTTECNRYEVEKNKHILSLDKYIHSINSYTYPDSFVEELTFVEKLFTDTLCVDTATLIVSDHGFSAFVREIHGANNKILDKYSPDHEGRCVWVDEELSQDSDYIIIDNPNDRMHKEQWVAVPLRHDSLGNLPKREVHGGATPEEVLVPIIYISPELKERDYHINPLYFEIEQGKPIINTLIITPTPRNPVLTNGTNEWNLHYDISNKMWTVKLSGLGTGTHKLYLNIDEKKYEITVKVLGGMKVRDLI